MLPCSCLSPPWLILHVGQAGVLAGGTCLKGRAPGDMVSSTCAPTHPILVDSSSHTSGVWGSLGPSPSTCPRTLSPLAPGEKGWQEHLPVRGAVLAPGRPHQQRNRVCILMSGDGEHVSFQVRASPGLRLALPFHLTCESPLCATLTTNSSVHTPSQQQ